MVKKIVVTTDGSPAAEKAAEFGIGHAAQLNARVICVTVIRPIEAIIGMNLEYVYVAEEKSLAKQLLSQGERAVDRLVEMAKKQGVAAEGKVLRGERVEEAISALARDEGADLIVIGMHGRDYSGFAAPEMGSVTRRLLATVPPCPVVLVPPLE